MGGRALAHLGVRRFIPGEYYQLEQEVKLRLKRVPFIHNFAVVPSYSKKESFGDMDVLITSSITPEDWQLDILELFSDEGRPSKGYQIEGAVMNVEFRELQIDLIRVEESYFHTALSYYSYNDLGNLMGRIAHKFGLKYGFDGLTYQVRDGDHVEGKVVVSTDTARIFEFLGFDFERFQSGFETLEDIYSFVASSKFYNPEIYLSENYNHKARKRLKKRGTHKLFENWISKQPVREYFQFSEEKADYLEHIFTTFAGTEQEVKRLYKQLNQKRTVKTKFNGRIVSEITGLSREHLSFFMNFLRKQFASSEAFREFILGMSEEEISVWIKAQLDLYP